MCFEVFEAYFRGPGRVSTTRTRVTVEASKLTTTKFQGEEGKGFQESHRNPSVSTTVLRDAYGRLPSSAISALSEDLGRGMDTS